MELRPNFPDLDVWPDSWKFTHADIRTGERLLDVFKPFVSHLVRSGVSRRTLLRHVDNLWLLGGELVRYAHHDKRTAMALRRAPEEVLLEFSDRQGGPVLLKEGPQTQAEVDVTFRALLRFLRPNKRGRRPRGHQA